MHASHQKPPAPEASHLVLCPLCPRNNSCSLPPHRYQADHPMYCRIVRTAPNTPAVGRCYAKAFDGVYGPGFASPLWSLCSRYGSHGKANGRNVRMYPNGSFPSIHPGNSLAIARLSSVSSGYSTAPPRFSFPAGERVIASCYLICCQRHSETGIRKNEVSVLCPLFLTGLTHGRRAKATQLPSSLPPSDSPTVVGRTSACARQECQKRGWKGIEWILQEPLFDCPWMNGQQLGVARAAGPNALLVERKHEVLLRVNRCTSQFMRTKIRKQGLERVSV